MASQDAVFESHVISLFCTLLTEGRAQVAITSAECELCVPVTWLGAAVCVSLLETVHFNTDVLLLVCHLRACK